MPFQPMQSACSPVSSRREHERHLVAEHSAASALCKLGIGGPGSGHCCWRATSYPDLSHDII
ncbi:hypothetical protein T492DRAFT_993386, partial [Pavlovales sp. CCMP2436]